MPSTKETGGWRWDILLVCNISLASLIKKYHFCTCCVGILIPRLSRCLTVSSFLSLVSPAAQSDFDLMSAKQGGID